MARRWLSLPVVAGYAFIVAGTLFIAVPNWERAIVEYRSAMDQHVWSVGSGTGIVETAIGSAIAISQAIVFTFAHAVVEFPILTLIFGVGSLLLGVVLVVEYGVLAEERQPWRGEWDM